MSFLYAAKSRIPNTSIISTCMFSDIKVDLTTTRKMILGDYSADLIAKYGIAKIIKFSNECCIGFAGNKIFHVNELMQYIIKNHFFDLEDVVSKAYEIHMKHQKDEIEFLICWADESYETHIYCIKEKNLERDVPLAWIGSPLAFRKMQKPNLSLGSNVPKSELFRQAVSSCGDDSVGGFIVSIIFGLEEKCFLFPERFEIYNDHPKLIPSGECIPFTASVEDGDFTVHHLESETDILLHFPQTGRVLAYTQNYRYDSICDPERVQFFMLPMIDC